jgi:DnaA family protein
VNGPGQLPLGIRLPREPNLDGFVAGPNGAALAAVRAQAEGAGEPYLYLWSEPGGGRSHLLLGACGLAQTRGAAQQYLDLREFGQWRPEALQGLETLALVALDNVAAVAGHADWERALFALFNQLRNTAGRLLVSGDCPAPELPFRLPDLRSRLAWGAGFRLWPLDDEGRAELLHRSAAARGMTLDAGQTRYILSHCPRDPRALEALLERLDRLTLAAQRRPTPALIRAALAALETDG